ncbi:FecR family protein [Dinghuibacter silviterrae]|uniref:FecR family protein n=1 Tax=Dinghuibacter silviterrae TaxID=1539049 RepID=A0A4R8DFX2_9BACT|nr:FecR family protein [Dinghuibacter silviterrae]TDW96375.1 FecR family protein [Dinghuibacter silviterrae]
MKDYLLYGVEDFVTDESYLRYYFRENEEDIRFWTEWIQRHPEKLDVVLSANNYIDAFAVRLSEAEFHREQQRFTESLDALDAAPRRSTRKRRLIGGAVAIIIAAVAYVAVQKSAREQEKVAMMEKYVPKGERAHITLPDGTEVTLNSDSRLTYPSKFTGEARELKLSGEAFFNVKQDQQHPFHVITSNLVVTVLGTSFNMECYPEKSHTKVALVTGKVRLDRITDIATRHIMGEALVLTPTEMGVFDKHDLSLRRTNFDPDEETGWRQGVVVFKDADFNDIEDRLDRVYNIRLVNKSHKTHFKFNGTFSDVSGEDIIKRICLSSNLSYIIDGNVITIH